MEGDKGNAGRGVPSLPVDEILLNVARSVVEAQRTLDAASLATEVRIREAGLDRQGLRSHWYSIPELDFELRLAFELGSRGELTTQMVDAEYQSKYGFDVKASSTLQSRIVATPPGEPAGISLLTEAEVLRRVGRLKRVVEAHAAADAPHFVTRYDSFTPTGYDGGLWYVLLVDTDPDGGRAVAAMIVIDDATGEVVRLITGSELLPGGPTPAPTADEDEGAG